MIPSVSGKLVQTFFNLCLPPEKTKQKLKMASHGVLMIGHMERGCLTRKEDLGTNILIEDQFGEWLRVMELGFYKNGYQNSRTVSSPKKAKFHMQQEVGSKKQELQGMRKTTSEEKNGKKDIIEMEKLTQKDELSVASASDTGVGQNKVDHKKPYKEI
ncbi:hypothetical protein DH2020_000252 [Rehmannia glutinosa]|uniref:Uncharacterized protein n=1 Tax=Rehmannia glutinosa TaxID=99300 RepID=A0ABR0XWC8_REHGL